MKKLSTELRDYALLLKEKWYTILVYDSADDRDITWILFSKDNKLWYVQKEKYWPFKFSSVHKPGRSNWTWFWVFDNIYEPTEKEAQITIDYNMPYWANWEVQKYKNIDDYLNRPATLKYLQF